MGRAKRKPSTYRADHKTNSSRSSGGANAIASSISSIVSQIGSAVGSGIRSGASSAGIPISGGSSDRKPSKQEIARSIDKQYKKVMKTASSGKQRHRRDRSRTVSDTTAQQTKTAAEQIQERNSKIKTSADYRTQYEEPYTHRLRANQEKQDRERTIANTYHAKPEDSPMVNYAKTESIIRHQLKRQGEEELKKADKIAHDQGQYIPSIEKTKYRNRLDKKAGKIAAKSVAEQDSEARKAWNKEDHYKSLGDRISDIVLGSTEQSIGQYGKFIPEVMAQASEGKAGRSGTVAHRGGMDFRDRANPNHVDKLQAEADRIRKQQYLGSVGAGQAASKLIAKGTEKAEQGMQGLSGGGKFAAETLQGATQLAIDLGIGATGLGMVPMGLRAAGGEVDTAMKSGATRKQALASGVAAGGIEMLTERIGNMGAILQKGFGKGISDDVVDRLLGKIAQKAASQGLKDLTHVSGRWLAAAAEEGLEEVIAEAVEPGLANAIYDAGNATILSDPEQALADWAHAGALGAVLGGVAGGGGVVAQHRTGSNIRRAGMVDDMMARAVNVDDEADAATAQGLKAVVDSGQPLTSLQVEKLSSIVSKQQRANNEKMDDAVRAATTVMARHGYSAPQDDDIRIQRGEDVVYATENLISAQSWGDDTAAVRQRSGEIADRMARLETGEFSNADVDTILSDPVQRTIYEQVTGVELPKAPSEARNAIYVRAADGLVAMAQTQTELDRNDAYQKLVKKKEGSFGAQGQGVHNRLFADLESRGVDSRDNDAVSDLEKAFEIMYNGGKNDYKFSELRNMFRDDPRFQNADVEFLNAAYNAGQADGKAQVRAAARRQAGILKADGNTKGRLITTNLSEENTPSIELRLTLESIARMTGNDIVLEDKLDNDVEGFYDNREIHIAANVKRPILSILTHEITHFIEDFAPEAWADLRDYAVSHADELYGVDINTLIENKIKQYANAGVKLDREGAIKEIIANTPKLYTDGSIIEDIVNANRPLGVRILMGIREALRKIRAAIAENSAADTRWLRADIEAVKEAERLWTDALAKAAENRGAAAEDNGERLSAAVNPLFISNNEMNANLHDVHGMSPVGEVAFNVDSVVTKNMSENVDAAYNYLLENGGVSFERNDVGGIDVTASGLGDVLRHGNARFKMSIMGIIPHVLTGGKIVAADQNHRGRGYNTVTLSAPVTLTGRGYGKYDEPGTYYAAVVLSRKYAKNGFISQKLHVTDVLIEKKDSRNMVQSAQVGTLSDAENLNLRDILRHVDADVNIFAEDSEQRQYSIASDEDYVTLTPERIDSIISEYAIPGNTSSDYSKAWIATINPRDFLTLTVSSDVEARWPEAELDNEELKKTRQMPYLTIDSSESNSVIGHEGRHRMLAMVNAGITESPVIIKDISESTKNNKQPMDTMDLWSQDFGSGPVNDTNEGMGADVDVYDLIPVNEKNRAEIERLYGGNTRVQFSIEEPVETSGDLIAVHNLYEDDIKNALELGGFPMPSIAVTNMPHDKYGDISLLFGSDTVDPEFFRANKIYGGDAYTPTFPEIRNKYNDKVLTGIRTKLEGILGLQPYQTTIADGLRIPSFDEDNVDNKLRSNDPFEAYRDDKAMQIAYLKNGKSFDVAIPTKAGTLRGEGRDFWEMLDDKMPELAHDDISGVDGVMEKYEPALRSVLHDYYGRKFAKLYERKPNAKRMYSEQMGYGEVDRFLRDLIKFRKEGIPETVDQDALDEILKANVDEEGYREWMNNLFDGVIEKRGIRNNKDLFTPSGNRRKWESLHDPVTLENVVRSMKEDLDAGSASMFGANPRGAAQKQYKNLDEVHADEGRLQMMDDEEYSALMEKALEKMESAARSIADHNETHSSYYGLGALDVGGYIAEVLNQTRDKAKMKRILTKEYNLKITDSEMDDVMDAIDAIAEVPTGYFEAKPKRAVGLDEVKAAIIPQSLSDDVKQQLVDHGIKTTEYNPDIEGDRAEKVNQAAEEGGLRFSIADESRVMYTPAGVEVVQNPTSSEYNDMRNAVLEEYPWLRGTGEPLLRKTYDEEGNEYYWDASSALHSQVEPYINKKWNTRTSQQYRWWEDDDKDYWPRDYSGMQFSIEEASESGDINVPQFSLREEEPPKKTKDKIYKLFKLYDDGTLGALFIDKGMRLEVGKWYNADSPTIKDLEDLEAGHTYFIDGDGNAELREYKSKSGNPGKKDIEQATEDGGRLILVDTYKDGRRKYHNWGINGSGSVSSFAMRPGWHATDAPSARHIGAGKNGAQSVWRREDEVWAEISLAADNDYQAEAEANPEKDIQTHIPTDGYYYFKTNTNADDDQAWYISGAIKIDRILSDEEAEQIAQGRGVTPDLPRKSGKKFVPNEGARLSIDGENGIIPVDTIRETLQEKFYKDGGENLDIATEAIDNLQRLREADAEGGAGAQQNDVGEVRRGRRRSGAVQYSIGNSGINTVGRAISDQFINTGYVDLRGQTARSTQDIAEICQVFRDPRFETFRIIYVRNGKIVSSEGISSKIPGLSSITRKGEDFAGMVSRVQKKISRVKADQVFLLHNHPSGEVNPSRDDMNVTGNFEKNVPEFAGHVIIDHDKYCAFEKGYTYGTHDLKGQTSFDFMNMPSIDHPLLNEKVRSDSDLARIAKGMQTSSDVSAVVYISSSGKVRELQEISNAVISNDENFKGYIRNEMRRCGAKIVALCTEDGNILRNNADLIEEAYAVDIIALDRANNTFTSARDSGVSPGNYEWAGLTGSDIPSYTVSEDDVWSWLADNSEDLVGPDNDMTNVPVYDQMINLSRARRVASMEELSEAAKWIRKENETKLTHGRRLDARSVKEQMNVLIRELMVNSDSSARTKNAAVKQAVAAAQAIYPHLLNEDYDAAANIAYDVALDIIEQIDIVNDEMYMTYAELRDYFRTTKIWIPEQERGSDYNDLRKKNVGRLRISNSGIELDKIWDELCGDFPGIFDPETNGMDRLAEIDSVLDSFSDFHEEYTSQEMDELASLTAGEIMNIAYEGKPERTFADKKKEVYDRRTKALKERHREAMAAYREKEKARREKAVKEEREKKKAAVAKEKARGEEKLRQQKEKQKQAKARKKENDAKRKALRAIEREVSWLSTRLISPTDDKHIPEGYRQAVAQLLAVLDTQTERSRKLEEKYGVSKKQFAWRQLKDKYKEIAESESYGFVLDEGLVSMMEQLADYLDDKQLSNANSEQLDLIKKIVKGIRHGIAYQNKAFSDAIKEQTDALGRQTMEDTEEKINKHGGRDGRARADWWFLNESMATPRDYFEGIGSGMNVAFMALRAGMDTHVRDVDFIRSTFTDIFGKYAKKKKPGSELEKWRDDTLSKEFTLESGETIKLNPSQIMSLYCLMQRKQAIGHILGSGIIASDVSTKQKLKEKVRGKAKATRGRRVTVTLGDITQIVETLTEDQREMATKMQDLLNGPIAEWGNETSMKMNGYKKFEEEKYFPIQVEKTYLSTDFDVTKAAERVKNPNFSKSTVQGASNPIVIADIFSVVADHCNAMSMYRSFAPAIADFQRVYNHVERDENGLMVGSVKESLKAAYGQHALEYIETFMTDLNGTTPKSKEALTSFVTKSLANYKKAAIGFNLRVAVQQPTAIIRAMVLINPKYFAAPKNPKRAIEEMKEHCPIALWKSWGFSQVDMARSMEEIMMNQEWSRTDVITMQAYGALDTLTWSQIWGAVKREVKAKNPDVEYESQEFWDLCNERASEVFDKTQVVDSVFHRSQVMRSNGALEKLMTSFMAEPTRTFNMVWSQMREAKFLWKDGQKGKATAKANRALTVYIANAALVSMAAAVADALRGKGAGDGDDDDKGWSNLYWSNFIQNFIDNANPLGLMPLAKDVVSMVEIKWDDEEGLQIERGYGTQFMALEGLEKLMYAFADWTSDKKSLGEKVRATLEGAGYVFGIPASNVFREFDWMMNRLGAIFATEKGEDGSDNFVVKLTEKAKEIYEIKLGGKEDTTSDSGADGKKKSGKYADIYDEIEQKTQGLSGYEKQDKIWDIVTEGYTSLCTRGDYKALREMRKVLKKTGGDVNKFDEAVLKWSKSGLKKNISDNIDYGAVDRITKYLRDNGLSKDDISEVIKGSDAAKKFQKALQDGDKDAERKYRYQLIAAGLTFKDVEDLTNKAYKKGSGTFQSPIAGEYTITSHFGARTAPTAGASSNHPAIDIGIPVGTPVLAADSGKVVYTGSNGGYGISVGVDHGNGYVTYYNHLSGYGVKKGDYVRKGQEIAKSGNTGRSTGPHLDFKILKDGTPVDPEKYIR